MVLVNPKESEEKKVKRPTEKELKKVWNCTDSRQFHQIKKEVITTFREELRQKNPKTGEMIEPGVPLSSFGY